MTTGQEHGELWSAGARDWAALQEPNFYLFYQAVHERLGIESGTRLLDVGCGTGGAALFAARRGARVAGLDASPGSIEVARERVPSGDFRVGDMESLPWPDGAFEAVTAFNSVQFAGSPLAVLKEIRRVLVPGGRVGIVIWAPREQSDHPRVMDAVSALAPPQPPNAPGPFALSEPGTLESLLAEASFREVDSAESTVAFEYSDTETACRALMSSGRTAGAVKHSGEEPVRQAILDALAPFRTDTGGYRLQNRFRFVIADRDEASISFVASARV